MSTAIHEHLVAEMPHEVEYRAEKRTLSMQEFSKQSGIPRSTLYDLANAGEFPCRILRVGGRWYVPVDAAEELLSGKAAA